MRRILISIMHTADRRVARREARRIAHGRGCNEFTKGANVARIRRTRTDYTVTFYLMGE